MQNYYLYLDESGQFEENLKTKASIIAGFLGRNLICTEQRAEKIFSQVKAGDANFSEIEIDPFHAMESNNKNIPQFIVALLNKIAKENFQIITFKSQKNYNIVNSDVTYLNVFAEGIVNLVQRLLAETNDEIILNVLYASRLNVKDSEKRKIYISIEEKEYTERIEERIAWRMAQLNLSDRNRVQIKLTVGKALNLKTLMLADAVCFALRGGTRNFTAEQKAEIKKFPIMPFSVVEQISWSTIQNALIENRLADAIYFAYGTERQNLPEDRTEIFSDLLINKLKNIGSVARKLQFNLISQLIGTLVENREYQATNNFIDALEEKIFPLLREQNIDCEEFYFDVHFYKLTVATHQGNTLAEQREIKICREHLSKLPATCETLDYYLKYKLREVEHLKNIYDFEKSIEELNNLEKILSDTVSLVQMIEELGDFGKNISSTTLGKVIGSRTAAKIYSLPTHPQYLKSAREDSDAAIAYFIAKSDKARQYQTRSMLETVAKNFDESLSWLGKAFEVEENISPTKVLQAIMNFQGTKIFGFLHYTNLMATAMECENSLGKKMYDAWINLDAESVLLNNLEYPEPLIYRQIGKCRALQGNKNAKKYYDAAIKSCLDNPNNFTIYFAGLIIEADKIVTFFSGKDIKILNKFCEDCAKFIKFDIPQSMKIKFADFDNFSQKIKKSSAEDIKNFLSEFVKSTPLI